METKLIKVFFDANCLPYKDSERSVHFPIVGGAFLGASNTTKIRFYFDRIGDTSATYVSVAKLPNGKQGSQVLSKSSDDDGNYAELELSNWYTQAKGDVYIALQGYSGGTTAEFDETTGLWTIEGNPIIQTTGSIKLAINYAPIGDSADYNDEFTTYQEILAGLGDKVDKKETSGPHAYTHDGSVQGEIKVEKNDIGGAIVQRTENAQIIVPYTPSTDNNATSKKYVDDSIASAISSVYKYKGSVATYSDLPSSGLTIGDVYNVEETGDNYAWTGTTWDKLAGDIDLSDYATKNYVDTGLSGKQNTLVNQVNIKSINGESLLGTGNIDIQGGGGADYTAGYGIDIADDTISVDTDNIATRDFVNSSIATNTATFRGTYNVISDLSLTTSATHQEIASAIATKLASLSIVADDNDYVFVSFPNATVSTDFDKYERYKFNGTIWEYEYTLNNSSFTAEQWAAINSGITSGILSGLATKVEVNNVNNNIAPAYDNTLTYAIGEVVIHENKLYRCISAITTAEDWDSTHWEQITVANGFVNLTGTQVISGIKTFNNGIQFNESAQNPEIKWRSDISRLEVGKLSIGVGGNDTYSNNNIIPYPSNTYNLGTGQYKWKDLYLSGTAHIGTGVEIVRTDGTNPVIKLQNQFSTVEIKNYGYHLQIASSLYLSGGLFPLTTNNYSLGNANNTWKDLYLSGGANIGTFTIKELSGGLVFDTGSSNYVFQVYSNTLYTKVPIMPLQTGVNLGASTSRFATVFSNNVNVSNEISDGTNSATVAQITGGIFNVINASDITNNTLTQAQYDLITNGKPTLIKGTFFNLENVFILGAGQPSFNEYDLIAICNNQLAPEIRMFILSATTKVISLLASDGRRIRVGSVSQFNGKAIPAYPSSTGTFNIQCVNGSLAWNEQWYGTQAEYDALGTYDSNTIYNILES